MVDVPKYRRTHERPRLALTDRNVLEVLERCLAVLDDPRDRALVGTFALTPLRKGEVLALQAPDVDLTGARLQLIRQRDENSYKTRLLKSDRQRRIVQLPPRLLELYREVFKLGPATVIIGCVVNGPRVRREQVPFLFPHRKQALERVQEKVEAICPELREAGGPAWHAWRHAWALAAKRQAKMTVYDISRALGHSSTAITDRYLTELEGYDQPVSGIERLWAWQAGQPIAVADAAERPEASKGNQFQLATVHALPKGRRPRGGDGTE